MARFFKSQSVATLGQFLARLQVLLGVQPAHLLHEVLQDGLLAVLLAVYLYGGDK